MLNKVEYSNSDHSEINNTPLFVTVMPAYKLLDRYTPADSGTRLLKRDNIAESTKNHDSISHKHPELFCVYG